MNGYWISAERNLYGQCEIMTEIFSGNIESGRLKPLTISIVSAVLTGLSYGFGIYLFPMVMPEMLKDLHLNTPEFGQEAVALFHRLYTQMKESSS